MDFYFLNTYNNTLIIADCNIYEYPKKHKKQKETNAIIVNKYMNVSEIIKTVNDIRKLKKTTRLEGGKYTKKKYRVRIPKKTQRK